MTSDILWHFNSSFIPHVQLSQGHSFTYTTTVRLLRLLKSICLRFIPVVQPIPSCARHRSELMTGRSSHWDPITWCRISSIGSWRESLVFSLFPTCIVAASIFKHVSRYHTLTEFRLELSTRFIIMVILTGIEVWLRLCQMTNLDAVLIQWVHGTT